MYFYSKGKYSISFLSQASDLWNRDDNGGIGGGAGGG